MPFLFYVSFIFQETPIKMHLQIDQVPKLWLYKDAKQARHENSRDIRMSLEESEMRILSRIGDHESEAGLNRQVYTVYLYTSNSVILKAPPSPS